MGKLIKASRYVVGVVFGLLAVPTIAAEPTTLLSAIQKHVRRVSGSDVPQHRYALIDLNGDGIMDAVVLLTDRAFCGSGGCTLEIFRGTARGFIFVSGSTLSSEPIRVAAEASAGWKTLIVADRGVHGALLRFDGRRYAISPGPRASDAQIQAATILRTLP